MIWFKNMLGITGIIVITVFLNACKKEKPDSPVVTTTAVTGISYTVAASGGEVTSDGGAPVIARGIYWGTTTEPSVENSKTIQDGGTGVFTSNITGLTPNTLYYVRAYATNSAGTGYGNELSFTTNKTALATLTTLSINTITPTTAISGGNITDDKGGNITARGICWSTAANPTTSNNTTEDGTGTGSFVSNLTGLLPETTYYVRSFAVNSSGTSYGDEISFTTSAFVSGITLNASSVTLLDNESYLLIPTIIPSNAYNKNVSWYSNNPDVATVNGEGIVTTISFGIAEIKVATADGSFNATCNITVVPITSQIILSSTYIINNASGGIFYSFYSIIRNNSKYAITLTNFEVFDLDLKYARYGFKQTGLLEGGKSKSLLALTINLIDYADLHLAFIWYFTYNGKSYTLQEPF
jgi:hypothetical protein